MRAQAKIKHNSGKIVFERSRQRRLAQQARLNALKKLKSIRAEDQRGNKEKCSNVKGWSS